MSTSAFRKVTVEEIAAPSDGSIAIGPFGSSMKSSLYTPSGVPVIRGNNIGSGRTTVGDFVFVSEETADRLKRSQLAVGDLFFPHRGAIGEVGIVRKGDPQPALMSTSLMRLRVDTSKADPEFVFWFFKSAIGRHEILLYASTVGTPGIGQPLTSLRSMTLPLPTLEEQQQIAAVLNALDDKIELNRRMSATLEEMARALYRSWFVDFDPVHARALGRPPAHMDPATAVLFPDSFGPDGLPKGWETKRLGDLLTLNYGKALKKNLRVTGPFPVYGSGGSDSTHEKALIDEPTIIVGRKGTVGSVRWAPNGCWPIDTTFYVTTDIPLTLAFRVLEELPLSDMNTDAAVPGLNRDNAYRLEVAFPDESVVRACATQLDSWQAKIDHLESENATLATLRDALLPRLISGELRVQGAEKQIEENV